MPDTVVIFDNGDVSIDAGWEFPPLILQPVLSFIRGDDNGDGLINVADPVFNLDYQFSSGPTFCLDAQDTNDDGAVDIGDPVYNLSYQFSLGPMPPAPFVLCGVDPTSDGLGCAGMLYCP